MKKYFAYLVIGLCVLFAVFVGYVNIDTITGTFGDGPPYYGRTTNMDKWENPLPTLVAIDAIALIFIFFVGRWAYRQIRYASGQDTP